MPVLSGQDALRTKSSDIRTIHGPRSRRTTAGRLSGCQTATIAASPLRAKGGRRRTGGAQHLPMGRRCDCAPVSSSSAQRSWLSSGQARPEVRQGRVPRRLRSLGLARLGRCLATCCFGQRKTPPRNAFYTRPRTTVHPMQTGLASKLCKVQALAGHVGGRKPQPVCPKVCDGLFGCRQAVRRYSRILYPIVMRLKGRSSGRRHWLAGARGAQLASIASIASIPSIPRYAASSSNLATSRRTLADLGPPPMSQRTDPIVALQPGPASIRRKSTWQRHAIESTGRGLRAGASLVRL